MSYIGTAPTIGNFQVCDAISVVNGQASYTMQVSSVNVVPQSANHMLVSLNGILQAPNSSFTVSGSTITFASNLVTGDVIDFIQILGSVLDLGVPSDNTVSLAKLTATGTKDATTFLRGDNTFAEAGGGGKVLQVLTATDFSERSTTSTSFVTASNTLSVDITPSATSSKILIMANSGGSQLISTGHGANYTIFRDSTNLGNSTNGFHRIASYSPAGTHGYIHGAVAMSFLDSPNSTSQITYQVYFKTENSSYTSKLQNNVTAGSIICMEIGA